MRVLVTGRSGSGKSTVCRELQQRGLDAFDGDRVPGLSGWVDTRSYQPIEVDDSKPIDRATTLWYWDRATLQHLLAAHENVFLCGSADNDLDFADTFDKILVLTISPETQRQRILARTEHNYGKLPGTQNRVLSEQREFVKRALRHGAIAVDAEFSPSSIADEIVRLADAH